MKKFLALIASAIMLLAVSAPVATATGADSSYMIVHEFGQQGHSLGDHFIDYKVDTGNLPNLSVWTLGLFAGCDNLYDDWNDCISEVELHLKAGTCVGFFDDYQYGGIFAQYGYHTSGDAEVHYWAGTSSDNRASSIRWGDFKLVGGAYHCVFGNY